MIRRSAVTLLLGLGLLADAARASGPAVVSVQPAFADSMLVCLLETEGLPGDRIVSTLRSGVDSAVELSVELLGENGDLIAGRDVLLVLSFDLWEERYAVRDGEREWRFRDLAALREHLHAPPALPLAPLALIDAGAPAFLRAGLKLHPIAPRTRGRIEELVTGADDGRRRRSTDEGQEATVSMSRLIRFFYKGGARDDDLVGVRESRRFRPGELVDAPH